MSTPEETERLRAEIEHTREQLGETVQALTHKVDVPARAKEKLQQTREAAQDRARQVAEPVLHGGEQAIVAVRRRPMPAAAVAVLAVLLLGWLLRRRLR